MTQESWTVTRITLVLYPLGAGAMAVNVFFLSLIFSWIGGPVLSTGWSIALGCVIGGPATWYFASHIRHLMDIADGRTEG